MNAESTARSRTEVIDEVSKWSVGGGVLVVAIAPLAIPILALTAVALLPLLVPLLAIGLLGAIVGAPIWLVRRLLGRRSSGTPAKEEVLTDVELAPLHR